MKTDPYIPHVVVQGKEIPMDDVEFLDIEEDFCTGRDIVTFNHNGKTCQSFVVIRPNPDIY